MSVANKQIARRLYEEVINAGQLDLLSELIAPDATGFSSTVRGPEIFVEHVRGLRRGVSDACVTVTDLIAEGDRVVVYWRLEGTHSGELWQVPASGNRIDGSSISLITLREGKIVDYQVLADRLTILRQIGALPA